MVLGCLILGGSHWLYYYITQICPKVWNIDNINKEQSHNKHLNSHKTHLLPLRGLKNCEVFRYLAMLPLREPLRKQERLQPPEASFRDVSFLDVHIFVGKIATISIRLYWLHHESHPSLATQPAPSNHPWHHSCHLKSLCPDTTRRCMERDAANQFWTVASCEDPTPTVDIGRIIPWIYRSWLVASGNLT